MKFKRSSGSVLAVDRLGEVDQRERGLHTPFAAHDILALVYSGRLHGPSILVHHDSQHLHTRDVGVEGELNDRSEVGEGIMQLRVELLEVEVSDPGRSRRWWLWLGLALALLLRFARSHFD